MLYRDDEPIALVTWDSNNESCPPATPINDHLSVIDQCDFDMLLAFKAYPVMTMNDYVESMGGMNEDVLQDGTVLFYGNGLMVEIE